MKKRLLTMLVLLVAVAAGAWADTTVTWTASDMTDLTIDFEAGLAADNTIKGITVTASSGGMGVWQGNNISMDEGSATITFTSSVGNIKSIALTAQSIYSYGDTPSGWTMPDYKNLSWSGDASPTVSMTLSDWTEFSNISEIVFTIESAPAASGYSVTLAEGTEDGDNWTIEPKTGLNGGETVTATYSGEKKVKSVKAVKVAKGIDYSTAQLGDLFYSDGTFSTTLEAGKTPIGVIAYLDKEGTDDDGITEKSNGAGHGLVLCLKNAASNVAWSTNISSQAYTGNAFVTDVAGLKRSEGVSGYSATAALATDATNYPAAAAAKNYTGLTAPTSTTGWFLPSAQQLVKMIEGLGGLDDGAPNIGSYFDNNHEGADKWENAIKKAGDGKYDSMTSNYLVYWSSSENSVGYAVILAVDARSTGTSRGFAWLNYGKDGTADMFIVRPVLAF